MRLLVSNLKKGTKEEKLERLFAKYGYVEDVVVWWDSESQSLKAYVEMPDEDAKRAMSKLDGRDWHDRRLKVTRVVVQNLETPDYSK